MSSDILYPDAPEKRNHAAEMHCSRVIKLWSEIASCSDAHHGLDLFHEILHEISDFSNGRYRPVTDQQFGHAYLGDLADLLMDCSYGLADRKQLENFLRTHWMNLPSIRACISDPGVLPHFAPVPEQILVKRGPDRRSGLKCRRSSPRDTFPMDRRIRERRLVQAAATLSPEA